MSDTIKMSEFAAEIIPTAAMEFPVLNSGNKKIRIDNFFQNSYNLLARFSGLSLDSGDKISLSKSSNDFYIKNLNQDKDFYFQVNDGGVTKTLIFLDGSEAFTQIPDGVKLTIGSGNDGQIYSLSDDIYFDNTTQDKDIIFQVNDGGSTKELLRINADVSFVNINDNGRLTIGTGNDGQIYSSSDDLYIENLTSSKDIIFRINNGGPVNELLRLIGSSRHVNYPDNIVLTLGTGEDGWIYSASDDIYINNITNDKDIIFFVNDGNVTKELLRLDGSEAFVNINDSGKLTIGSGNDGQIYSSSDDIYFNNVTQDKDIIFQVNDGGATKEILRFDSSEPFVRIHDNAKLTIGTGNDGQIYSSSDDIYFNNVTQDKDIIFQINDGGATKELLRLNADVAFVNINDNGKLTIGTGNDGQIYSSSDDLYIDNMTQDKDIIFQVNDGGVTTEAMRIDANEPAITFFQGAADDWSSTYATLQLGGNTSFMSTKARGASSRTYIFNNLYFDGTDNRYQSTDEASLVIFGDGKVLFRKAASGTAGEVATVVDTFTIDNSGHIYAYLLTQTSAAGLVLEYNSSTKEIYAETSSARFKENIRDMTDADSEWIHQIKPKFFDSTTGSMQKNQPGFIAEDFQVIKPDMIVRDNQNQIVGYGQLWMIPYLHNEIKKLRREINTLKGAK